MHAKTDSDGTSIDASWLPKSPRRPIYYVQSPSNHDVEKMSYGSSPAGSPTHHYYHCSPIHHSRESSTSRFSASLKNPRNFSTWKHVQLHQDDDDDDETYGRNGGSVGKLRLYVFVGLFFVFMFTVFCLILWGASKAYRPKIIVKLNLLQYFLLGYWLYRPGLGFLPSEASDSVQSLIENRNINQLEAVLENIVFQNFYVQAGNDGSGVPTDMLSLNSTVKILYRNPATFFAVHVTSTPLELHYFRLKLAAGQMKKFTESRKSQRKVVTVVKGHQVPLYGGVSVLANSREHLERVEVPLNLTFLVRSRAYILGRLVKSKFHSHIRCSVTLKGNKLGKPQNLTDSCIYD